MARRLRTESGVPANLATFDPLDWGADGDAAVERWKAAALQYLDEHPDKTMPLGDYGDQLAVIREAIRLKGGYDRPGLSVGRA